ncbi:metal ABC transporter permease [uncultured Thermanaerothrix sp.]|uniref:metal ABC transporter permease n=1 Tax=uncultured Thermanaerothrix sp. TaxID=1195149 RepID=UPI00262F1367|nr:metal ABC transporter permease [uncultured Thermanaerothrix sp.]
MLEVFLQPFQYAFMMRGMLAAILVGVVCAVVGTFVVLRGMAFFGDALAHTILPGLAVGYLIGGGSREALFWWALGTAVLSAVSIGTLSRKLHLKEDTAIGIIFAGMFALGVALISSVRSYSVDLAHFLFGDILAVRTSDLVRSAIFGGLVLILIYAFYKEFTLLSFDPVLAATLRLPASLLDLLLVILIAVTIVVSLQTVGVALMVAMLITPAATASLLTRRLPLIMLWAAVIAAFSGVIGLYLSYYFNVASGAAIVLTCTLIFILVSVMRAVRERFMRVSAT